MDDNTLESLKSMLNGANIPSDLQNVLSNMASSNKNDNSSSNNNSISPETINNLMSMLNSKNSSTSNSSNTDNNSSRDSSQNSSNNIDFETIMKFKSIMDKMNSKDDPRSKLLISLKPYLKESRKNKVDQYIQFLNMSKIIDIFSKSTGDGKL